MVSTSEGMVYYCTVFLTALVFLTEASAITTHYEKSTASQNKTNESPEVSPQRTKLTSTRGRGNLSKNQNHERVTPLILSRLKSPNKDDAATQAKPDQELLLPSNSGGETEIKDKGVSNVDDDDQKTLSQQVADGKYGLIQHEIFTAKPDRPGVISYDINPEVPKDNINNLGGLEPEDIWLAENHLLVLAGGNLNNGMQTQWRPIDNYIAPKRPVKLTPNPKIPPPFPVQLTENGPIEYLKPSGGPSIPFTPFFNPLHMPFPNIGNKTQSFPQPLYGKIPNISQYGVVNVPQLKPSLPTQPPVLVKPPPGADIIPPYLGINQSEPIDEDDPSLYYPPPYDFYYPLDNTSKVPPGPLVPGIVLPPPPDFFSLMTNKTGKSRNNLTPLKPAPYYHKNSKQLQYNEVDIPTPNYKDIKSTTSKPKEQSTFAAYDDIINEVTYPETKGEKITYADEKENKVSTDEVEDWVPIPAPKPFYITGPKKPVKNTVLLMMETPLSGREFGKNGFSYNKPESSLKLLPIDESTVSPYREKSTRRPKLKYVNRDEYSTTKSIPLSSTTPSSIKPVDVQYFSTTPLSTHYNAPVQTAGVDTIKATYYFYEEPTYTKTDVATPSYPKHVFSTTSTVPAAHFNDYPKVNVPHKNTHQETSKRKPIMPMIPIYYLAELDNIVDLIKPMNLPYKSGKSAFYTTTSKPTYSISKPTFERPTSRPIFEYSYIASDYNGQSNQVTESTPNTYKEPHYPSHVDYTPYYPQQQFQTIYSPLDYSTPVQTTPSPLLNVYHLNEKPLFSPTNTRYHQTTSSQSHKVKEYDSFDRPWVPNLAYTPISYQTENPFYAFFTKEDEDLIDENTKKYFTIFGQKLRNVESTSPIPAAQSVTSTTVKPIKSRQRTQPSQTVTPGYSDRPTNYGLNFYTSTVPYIPEYTTVASYRRKPTSTSPKPEPSQTSTTVSLEGDTLVNYVTPLPEKNPDAEFITPKISKYIRPIVVEDLPPDVNERLKNLMRLNRQNKRKKLQSTGTRNKYRYVLIDNHQHQNNLYQSNEKAFASEVADLLGRKPTSKGRNPNPEFIESSSSPYRSVTAAAGGRREEAESETAKPISLKDDILVNYKNKNRLTTNPDAEYIDGDADSGEQSNPVESYSIGRQQSSTPISLESDFLVNYRRLPSSARKTNSHAEFVKSSPYKHKLHSEEEDDNNDEYDGGSSSSHEESQPSSKPISLDNDILVNYKNKNRLTTNPDAEYIDTSNEKSNPNGKGSSNIISYKYPGVEHGHFYFLTPQETYLTRNENDRFNLQQAAQESADRYFRRVPRDYENVKNSTIKVES